MSSEQLQPDRLDAAVRSRLRRLAQARCDSSALERRLGSAIEAVTEIDESTGSWVFRFRRPLVAAAALVAIAATLAIVLTQVGRGASAIQLSEVVLAHQRFLSSDMHLIHVQDVGQANHECQSRWPGAPTIPEVGDVSVRCCCVEEMRGCRTACLHFDHKGVPVTMAVVDRAQFEGEGVSTIERGGSTYNVLSDGRFSVVTTTGTDQCVCFVSELPQEDLLALAMRIDS